MMYSYVIITYMHVVHYKAGKELASCLMLA